MTSSHLFTASVIFGMLSVICIMSFAFTTRDHPVHRRIYRKAIFIFAGLAIISLIIASILKT